MATLPSAEQKPPKFQLDDAGEPCMVTTFNVIVVEEQVLKVFILIKLLNFSCVVRISSFLCLFLSCEFVLVAYRCMTLTIVNQEV